MNEKEMLEHFEESLAQFHPDARQLVEALLKEAFVRGQISVIHDVENRISSTDVIQA